MLTIFVTTPSYEIHYRQHASSSNPISGIISYLIYLTFFERERKRGVDFNHSVKKWNGCFFGNLIPSLFWELCDMFTWISVFCLALLTFLWAETLLLFMLFRVRDTFHQLSWHDVRFIQQRSTRLDLTKTSIKQYPSVTQESLLSYYTFKIPFLL